MESSLINRSLNLARHAGVGLVSYGAYLWAEEADNGHSVP